MEPLAADPRRYVNKILESYERMFKEKPRKSRPPLEGGDHPEPHTPELCDEHQTNQFQTLIGQLQWLISPAILILLFMSCHFQGSEPSLGRETLIEPKGLLDTYCSYLMVQSDSELRSLTSLSLKEQVYDWTRSVYSGACEQIPHDIPKPLRKHGQTTHYVDSNLHHDPQLKKFLLQFCTT